MEPLEKLSMVEWEEGSGGAFERGKVVGAMSNLRPKTEGDIAQAF